MNDLLSACNNVSVDEESASALVASLSNILDKQCEYLAFLRMHCHGSLHDAYLQGRSGVKRPSKARTKNIGRKECRDSRRKNMDWLDGSG